VTDDHTGTHGVVVRYIPEDIVGVNSPELAVKGARGELGNAEVNFQKGIMKSGHS